jgi:hypothetical protein
MADHVRKQLREAVATALTGLATTGSRVYQSRVYPVQAAELPCLLVYALSESATEETVEADPTVRRDVEIRVEARAAAAADLDDTLDQVAKEVETALAAGVTVGGQGVELAYEGVEISLAEEGDKPHGEAAMNFRAVLFTQSGVPDVLT